jgi:SAM-dependent methyltransferase
MIYPTEPETIPTHTLDALRSPTGQAALAHLAQADVGEAQTLPLLAQLRRNFPPLVASALLTQARLRRRAAAKFPFADQLWLEAEALEQATAWPVARHHAAWIDQHAPPGAVLDLGCGIGGDTLALAQVRPVIAIDQDPVRLQLAQANAAALGLSERITFVEADWTALLAHQQLPTAVAAFADPSRRTAAGRVFSLHQMQPPLADLLALQRVVPALGVKVMPGVADAELPAGCGVEFISHEGVCKEAVLWFGPFVGYKRWASVHQEGGWERVVGDQTAPPLGDLHPGLWLHEPDPAVIRAGAFATLCAQLEGWLFDPEIAYLLSPPGQLDALVQTFVIEEVHNFGLKLLNRRFQALGIGEVELKKRGFPVEPESLRPRLKLMPGGRRATVIFTRRGDERLMILGRRVRGDEPVSDEGVL